MSSAIAADVVRRRSTTTCDPVTLQTGMRKGSRQGDARLPVSSRHCQLPQIERDPDQRAHDGQRQKQVRRQTQMADVGAVTMLEGTIEA